MKDSWDGIEGERENMGNIVINRNDHIWVRRGCELIVWNEQGKKLRVRKWDSGNGNGIHEARCICMWPLNCKSKYPGEEIYLHLLYANLLYHLLNGLIKPAQHLLLLHLNYINENNIVTHIKLLFDWLQKANNLLNSFELHGTIKFWLLLLVRKYKPKYLVRKSKHPIIQKCGKKEFAQAVTWMFDNPFWGL